MERREDYNKDLFEGEMMKHELAINWFYQSSNSFQNNLMYRFYQTIWNPIVYQNSNNIQFQQNLEYIKWIYMMEYISKLYRKYLQTRRRVNYGFI